MTAVALAGASQLAANGVRHILTLNGPDFSSFPELPRAESSRHLLGA